jgi:hypothetical protein
VFSFTPLPLYPLGNSYQYPLDRSLDGPQSLSGRRGEKHFFPLPVIEPQSLGVLGRNRSLLVNYMFAIVVYLIIDERGCFTL